MSEPRRPQRSMKAIAAAIVLLLLGVFAAYWIGLRKAGLTHPRFNSLAVLPLQNLSADPQQEYFVDGMTEALITDLAKIKTMKVISRTSVMPYKNTKKSMREIASKLQADAVIEGSVMRSADRVRITVQLIDASSDRHLWAESYERDLKNIFALQGEVAEAIAEQVRAVVTPQEHARLVKKHPVDPEVYELYLKGRHIMNRGGLEDVQKAIEYFQSGLAKDPNNALIYTGLADAYIHKMSDVHESPVEATIKARDAATKALELDESLAEAHTSLASIKLFYDWNWNGAEIELKRAMELNPGYSLAYRVYGAYLTIIGRHPQAIPYFEKARRLDPLYERNYMSEGYSDFMAHQYDEAIEQYRKGLDIQPDPMTYFGLVLAVAQKQDYTTAISEAEKATKLNNSPLLLTSLASAYAMAGRRMDSNRILRQLEEIWSHQGRAPAWHGTVSPYVCPYEVAGVYAQLRDRDRAFAWLDKAYQSRSCMYWLRQDPRLDSLHSDPRFQDLLTKMKFPQ
jgi:TolB-like protein/Tfp pilus assembly protein PilF